MRLKKVLTYIIPMYLGIFIFFSYIFGKDRFLLLGAVALLIGYTILINIKKENVKLRIYKNDIIILLIILLMSISMIYSIDFSLSLRYIQIFTMLFIVKILIQNLENSYLNAIIKVFLVLSFMHVLATHIYNIYPNFILKINASFMPNEQYSYNKALMKYGANAGICYDHAANALFITIFIMTVFSNILVDESKKVTKYIFLILGIVALMYTGKRGLAVANVLSIFVTAICYLRKKGKIVKKVFYYLIVLFIVIFIVLQFPATQILIERFTASDGTTLLNGREDIYSNVEENIKDNFLFGSGINTTQIITGGNDAHNTYLQVLSELGILGFVLYIILFAYNYFNVIKLDNNNDEKKETFLLMSLYYQTFFLTYSMTGNPLYNPNSILLYFIMSIFSQSNRKKENKNENRNINIS